MGPYLALFSADIRTFYPFVEDKSVRLIGVEAGGSGTSTDRHSATLTKGTKGVLHGVLTYILQSTDGQISETHSISAGLDYPGVGPEHAFLKDAGRAEYRVATDLETLKGFRMCVQMEGIIPALETAHAVLTTMDVARELGKDANVVMVRLCLMFSILKMCGTADCWVWVFHIYVVPVWTWR